MNKKTESPLKKYIKEFDLVPLNGRAKFMRNVAKETNLKISYIIKYFYTNATVKKTTGHIELGKREFKFSKLDVARKYRDEYGMEMPTKRLARIMYEKEKPLFANLENARISLQRIEGKAGKNTRVYITHPFPERSKNPYNLPHSDEREWTPYKLNGNKIGILSDIHVPYHSISALNPAIDRFIQIGIDTLLLNGDIMDCYSLSRFEKDPRKRSFAEELEIFTEFILALKKALNCKIVFKKGNHEERYENFLMRQAKELIGIDEVKMETILHNRIGEDVEIVGEKRIIQANGLDIIHGHEFAQAIFSPVNIARGLALRAKTSAIQGHNHTTSEHTERDLRGAIKTTWSMGCCCELHPEYMPINKWNHGFAELELDSDGIGFRVENYRVLNGKVL